MTPSTTTSSPPMPAGDAIAGAGPAAAGAGPPTFPPLPAPLEQLRVGLATGTGPAGAARPWDPASLDPDLRAALYMWLQATVVWHNATFAWQPATVIPACWPLHPHLTVDWLTVALSRLERAEAVLCAPLLEWHDRYLPGFHARMAAALGAAAGDCRAGRHTPGNAALTIPAWNTTAAQVWAPAPPVTRGHPL